MKHHYFLYLMLGAITFPNLAKAIALNWEGYFRANGNYIRNYQIGGSNSNAGGESALYEVGDATTFGTFFGKLKPTALITDNIILRSEWSLGSSLNNFFGQQVPIAESKDHTSSAQGSFSLNVARLWLDIHTELGLIQVGRTPLHWGLGVIFDPGGPMKRYQSTADTVRIISKFGNVTTMPFYSKKAVGKNLAGAQGPGGEQLSDSDDVSDYGLALKYHSPESSLEAGLLFYKRSASNEQETFLTPSTNDTDTAISGANGIAFSLLDFYAKRTWHNLTVQVELPFYFGEIGDINNAGKRNEYNTFGLATEVLLNLSNWKYSLHAGFAAGQEAGSQDKFSALYFHRNYKLGHILFNYNLRNFTRNNPDRSYNGSSAANSRARSPYDASIVNARYIMLAAEREWSQWTWGGGLVIAQAVKTAEEGKSFFDHQSRTWSSSNAVESQAKSLGWELDLSGTYSWDEHTHLSMDTGVFFPGDFFAFDNVADRKNKLKPVFSFLVSLNTAF